MLIQQGLQFRKLDLHSHTPASSCYKDSSHTADDIVRSAVDIGLEAIAITDHNSGEWIDEIKNAAANRVVVFPGVEISTHEGFHLVALFDTTAGREEIANFLGALDFTPGKYGRSDITCQKSVSEVVAKIHDRGGLAILAHIDNYKGAFFELTDRDPQTGKTTKVPGNCLDTFNTVPYDAVEVTSGRLPDEFYDRGRGFKRLPPYYQSSDNPDPSQPTKHSKDGLGKRYTWFKLDEINLEGLRQCFADPEVRIRQMDQEPLVQWSRVTRLKVGNSGFLAGQELVFHPGLNSLIGGKGAGKSLAIEFLRFALDQASPDDEIRSDHNGKLDKRLGPLTAVELEFTTENGARYVLKRTHTNGGESDVVCANADTGELYVGDISRLFPVLAYSQTEVIKIAQDSAAQLRLVDSLIDTRPFQHAVTDLQQQLTQNDRAIAEALEAREAVQELIKEIATYDETIRNIDARLSSPLLAAMRSADAKKAAMDAQDIYVKSLSAPIKRAIKEIEKLALPVSPENLVQDTDLTGNSEKLLAARTTVMDSLLASSRAVEVAEKAVADIVAIWMQEYDRTRKAYHTELAGTDAARLELDRRQQVATRATAQQKLAASLHLADDRLPILMQERQNLLDELERQHQRNYAVRSAKFGQLSQASKGRLKLELKHAANSTMGARAVQDLWKGSGTGMITTANREKMAANITPRQMIDLVMNRDGHGLAQAAGFTPDTAEKAINKAWGMDDFAEVLALQHHNYPEDEPSIQFNKGNNKFAPLSELSVGQKCTALLIIALCDGTMPVIIGVVPKTRTGSLVSASRFKLGWTSASECRMDAFAIIEDLDVGEHLLDGLGLGFESFLSQQLHFHRREERLHRRVVPHVALAAVAQNHLAPA